ncbi:MAG: hypothetical protein WD096_02285 [Actinomycetota bacterium]
MRIRHLLGPWAVIVGAVVVWVGALSEWATSSVDPVALRAAVAVDPEGARDVADLIDASYTWVEGAAPAAWMLTFVSVGIVLGVISLWRRHAAVVGSVAAIGGLVAVVAAVTRVDPVALAALIASDADTVVGAYAFGDVPLTDVIRVSGGPSTALCVAGACMMAIGGVLAFISPQPDAAADPGYVPWDHLHESDG